MAKGAGKAQGRRVDLVGDGKVFSFPAPVHGFLAMWGNGIVYDGADALILEVFLQLIAMWMSDIVDVEYIEKVLVFCGQDIVRVEVMVIEGGQVVPMFVHTVQGL